MPFGWRMLSMSLTAGVHVRSLDPAIDLVGLPRDAYPEATLERLRKARKAMTPQIFAEAMHAQLAADAGVCRALFATAPVGPARCLSLCPGTRPGPAPPVRWGKGARTTAPSCFNGTDAAGVLHALLRL